MLIIHITNGGTVEQIKYNTMTGFSIGDFEKDKKYNVKVKITGYAKKNEKYGRIEFIYNMQISTEKKLGIYPPWWQDKEYNLGDYNN